MDEGKSHDQGLLDVWAMGMGTGMMMAFESLDVPRETALHIVGSTINRHIRDPIATEQLLDVLRSHYSTMHPGTVDIHNIPVIPIQVHGDPDLG